MKDSTNHYSEISVKGLRRLLDVRLPLQPLSVVIGANGSGKTSILDAFALLAASAEGRLTALLADMAGLSNILTYDRANAVEFRVKLPLEGATMDYSLSLGARPWARPCDRERKPVDRSGAILSRNVLG